MTTRMRFPEQEVRRYSDPISESELEEGCVYFSVTFSDEEMLTPRLEPLVFVGRDLEAEDDDIVYFQDLASFQMGVRYDAMRPGENARFEAGSRNELNHIFSFDNALEVLLACALRREEKRD